MAVFAATLGLVFGLPTASADSASPTPTSQPDHWSASPVAASTLAQRPCAQVLFLGVRGSGEPEPFGSTIADFRDALRARSASTDVQQAWLDYPASSVSQMDLASVESALVEPGEPQATYYASVRAGVSQLVDVLDSSEQRCPDQRLALVGFSQGAEVVTRALAQHPQGAHLLAAVLLGNPGHFPGQNVQELDGTAGPRAFGVTAAFEHLRAAADPAHATNRQAQVQALVKALFAMYDGTVDTTALVQEMTTSGLGVHGLDAPHVYSVCTAGDLVCDAAQPLTRLLTGLSTISAERDRTAPLHEGYHGPALTHTLAAVAASMPAGPPPKSGAAVARGWFVVSSVIGLVVLGLVVVAHRTRRRPKRVQVSRKV